jgi:hypothetical protein
MNEFFRENLQNPARDRCAGAMRQFPFGQLDSKQTNSTHSSDKCDIR